MDLKALLDEKVEQYNQSGFIENDPISIPHRFTKLQDIEISGFWASILAWGNRKTIINKCSELLELMDDAPHDFVLNHQTNDLKRFEAFKHRTFNATDTLYFIDFFNRYYRQNHSLETAFTSTLSSAEQNVENGLIGFRKAFFNAPDYPIRTEKHVASPLKKSTCKRINMFLRWMVRKDENGVDFGIWKNIKPSQLVCPFDVHVENTARKLKLVNRPSSDWLTAVELTEQLKELDPIDPVKYDFALFGLGLESKSVIKKS